MGSEGIYKNFREALSLAESVRSGEEASKRLRIGALRRRQAAADVGVEPKTLSDVALEAELEEAQCERQLAAMRERAGEGDAVPSMKMRAALHEVVMHLLACLAHVPILCTKHRR